MANLTNAIQAEQATCAVRDEGIDVAVAARKLEESWGRNLAVAAAGIPTLECFVFSSVSDVSESDQWRLNYIHYFDWEANIVKLI
ncbi:hypothetical protein CSHISOI_08340 [Colletotrichum shisoi]|uniref:Uncharacterized protein n=1 Tax=Colletotrichum shisoi TaxID=2078593 RepID=A0A5Q4BKL0_9PEZI|nr:hypothetical protein CSHISOI_08340 [Colletotrichum shisoi]